jgi:aldehyde dehydrogenase (NAD+)
MSKADLKTQVVNTVGLFKELVREQRSYFESNITKSHEWRVGQLDQLSRMLSENMDAFTEAVATDFKTAISEKIFEVAGCLGTIDFTKANLKTWMQPVEAAVPRFLTESGHKAMIYREPYGVTLILGPFNAPLLSLLRPAITALAAGNTCILKVSEAPATAKLLLAKIPEYFDTQAVAAVTGTPEEIAQLLRMPLDFIYFTGSKRVGKRVMSAAAQRLTPVLLELGGQNPAVVDETANLHDAAKKIVWGATAWGGQWCTSPGYAYVHQSIADEFVAECRKAVVELYGPDPKRNSDYSRIINAREVRRLASLVDPHKVVWGGAHDEEERYFGPTILYPVSWQDRVMQDEIFGPILPVLTYTNFHDAISRIKDRPKPLAGYIFSRSREAIDWFLSNVSFGGGAVNQTNVQVFLENVPFGGVGESGFGQANGKYGYDNLTHAKSVLIAPPDESIDHLYPPFTMEKVQALRQWLDYSQQGTNG